jgi:hypothetical protein
MAAVSINRRFQSDLIVPPSLVKSNGEHIYRVVISGLIHFFHVANHPGDEDIRDMAVTLEGRLKIPAYEMRDVPFLCDYLTEIFKATRKENAT